MIRGIEGEKKRNRGEAPEPRQSIDPNIGLGVHNEHVYKYWRWLGWVNAQVRRMFASEVSYHLASDERRRQEPKPYTPQYKK